jgi:hypothetical protein
MMANNSVPAHALYVPDSLLNLYLRDGYYRILDLRSVGLFWRSRLLLIRLLSSGLIVLQTLLLTRLAQIVSIVDKRVLVCVWIWFHMIWLKQLMLGRMTLAVTRCFIRIWEGQIHLFPKPNNVRTLTVRGYREPTDWITDGRCC